MGVTESTIRNALRIEDLTPTLSEYNTITLPMGGMPLQRELSGDLSCVRFCFTQVERLLSEYAPPDVASLIISYWSGPIVIVVCDDIVFQTVYAGEWSNLLPLHHTHFNSWYFQMDDEPSIEVMVEYQNYRLPSEEKKRDVLFSGEGKPFHHVGHGGMLYPSH